MKLAALGALLSVTFGLVAAEPHRHAHHHRLHKNSADSSDVVIVYELEGHIISKEEMLEGIKNGTLTLHSSDFAPAAESAASAPNDAVNKATTASSSKVPAAEPASSSSSKTPAPEPASSTSSPPPPPPASSTPVAPSPEPAKPKPSSAASGSFNTHATGVDAEFPDNQISCSEFPSAYGAIKVPWMGLGGWTGVQAPKTLAGAFTDIVTMIAGLCPPEGCCSEGSYCSYACAPGYQKTQWPETQGSTGQSVGGLLCQNGKLQLTNPSLSKSLCMKGTSAVNVQIKNTMSVGAAMCRTDYPGTEGETVPLDATPGSVNPVTCPDGSNYYTWQGKSTSAQYYLNPAGVPVEDGCQWGSPAKPWGNYAPMNVGVGYSNGAAFLSIFQNIPTTTTKLDYNVELVGDNGGFDNPDGRCKYTASTGEFCTGNDYKTCSSDGKGCTVSVKSGTATFLLSQ